MSLFSQQVVLNIQSLSLTRHCGAVFHRQRTIHLECISCQDQSESLCHATRPGPTYFIDCVNNHPFELSPFISYINGFSYINCVWSLIVRSLNMTRMSVSSKRAQASGLHFRLKLSQHSADKDVCFVGLCVWSRQLNGEQWLILVWRNDVIFLLQPGIVYVLLLVLTELVGIRKTVYYCQLCLVLFCSQKDV